MTTVGYNKLMLSCSVNKTKQSCFECSVIVNVRVLLHC